MSSGGSGLKRALTTATTPVHAALLPTASSRSKRGANLSRAADSLHDSRGALAERNKEAWLRARVLPTITPPKRYDLDPAPRAHPVHAGLLVRRRSVPGTI
ncbi:hypothetical protein K432DRAFT_397156 [Lepidopterella palustris CBS 459.81]|uniref:Uncharacterized protein n=1 Tax=Lepidopterella palustris CBS 459.81 TaxID=1314670 RepID=A0A8E2JAT6_9PEZI|nr:hypothetical protein K432DRAFT_397156 [Lepidopterella palustris CBS 459.81]